MTEAAKHAQPIGADSPTPPGEHDMYTVNGRQHTSYLNAIKHAQSIGADVIEAETGKRRWTPAAAKPAKTTAHVLINKDGTKTIIGYTR